MSEDSESEQLIFDFAEVENKTILGEQQIAAPEDHSLEDPEPEQSQKEDPGQSELPIFLYSEFAKKDPVVKTEDPEPEAIAETEEPAEPVILPPPRKSARKASQYTPKDLQRAVLAWLASLAPTAAAVRVPTRLAKFRADAAAFWSAPRKKRLLLPERTVVVEARATRASCWPECSGSEEIVPELRRVHKWREELEAEIRKNEPWLLDSDVLFPEIEYWNYSGTKNPEYAKCIARIRNYEQALYRGSRFERIQRANVANELYMAVPEGMILPDELADGWGLLYIGKKFSVTVVRKAPVRECPQENMLHLSQNIAASSLADVLFAHGIYLGVNGNTSFRRMPRRRSAELFE